MAKPTHTACAVRNFENKTGEADSSWSGIGAGFLHKDGKGFDVVPDALPLSGRITLRLNTSKTKKEED